MERILLDVAPQSTTTTRVAVPLSERVGVVSDPFGTAPWFAFVDLRRDRGEIMRQFVDRNPFATEPRGRGLRVAEWLLERQTDLLVTRDDIRDKGPGHALAPTRRARAGARRVQS